MPSYFIFGPSGSGKTTVGEVLKQKGYRVIETDSEEGLSSWIDVKTGLKPSIIPAQPYPKEWLENHTWGWDTAKMNELLDSVGEEPVFFCGGASNDSDFYEQFDKIFGLHTNNEKLKTRLQSREPQRWVDDSAELERMLRRNEEFKSNCIGSRVILVDSSSRPQNVADKILGLI